MSPKIGNTLDFDPAENYLYKKVRHSERTKLKFRELKIQRLWDFCISWENMRYVCLSKWQNIAPEGVYWLEASNLIMFLIQCRKYRGLVFVVCILILYSKFLPMQEWCCRKYVGADIGIVSTKNFPCLIFSTLFLHYRTLKLKTN